MFRTELFAALFFSCLLAGDAAAQRLRHGVRAGELVIVAEVESTSPYGEEAVLHRLRPLRTLKGEAPEVLTVVEVLGLACRPRPIPGPPRIYCLSSAPKTTLPAQLGPFYQMTGFLGDHPRVELDPMASDPHLQLVGMLVELEDGGSAAELSARFANLALTAPAPVCTEAVEVLRVHTELRDRLDTARQGEFLARAVGEKRDFDYQNSLASLCAELQMPGVIDALCSSLESTPEPEVARTIGRLARYLHGEQAILVLQPHLLRASRSEVRDHVLLAIGSTETRSALEALLKERRDRGPGEAVDAALRAHGSPKAMKAVRKKN